MVQDHDAGLNAVVFGGGHSHCADSVRVFVLLAPAVHVLIDERLYLRWPSFDASAGAFAFVQGDDELGTPAVSDIEGPRFPSGAALGRRACLGAFRSEEALQ